MADAKKIVGGLGNIGKRLTAPNDEGALSAIRTAGRTAHEQEAAIRAAKDAKVAEQMANLPARSKKANEALGLYHPIGGGLKLSKPTHGMHATTVRDPKFNPPEIGIITPEQLVKEEAALFPLVGDRAAGGKYLTHVGENELETPVRLTAGPLYMDANYNHIDPDLSAAWESGVGRTTALGKQAGRAGEGGRPVYGIYTAGSGTNTDFNVMGANALLQQIPYSKISKKAEREFDRAMKEGTKEFAPIPNWPGIRSPEAQAMLLDKSNGIARTKLFGVMGKENFQSMGFPDVPATRKAIIEPELLDVPTNQAGFRLARMDATGRIIENPNIPSDYPSAMAGKVAGRLDVPADYKDIFQSHFDARRLLSQPESGDYYSFSRAHPIQYADDEWLNRLMEQRLATERRIKEGEYKDGGSVDIDAADARLAAAIEKRMAKGGSVDIEAADARLEAAINARMGMAEGGATGFKKIEFMADGGKLVKGLNKIGKKLFADSDVLPQVEREANLQKFLAPSAEKRRMYHGSKEPNITEFKTRKDLTNEDNMTGHYADERDAVFLSPEPEFSKDFSVWGYTDEGKAPTTYPVYAQVERPFDFDNPEHLQKVKATYLDMFHNPESEFYDPHITSSERSMDLHRFNRKVDDLPKDENNWGRIENQQFQDVLKDIGFDSFYTRERGTKNLGIYDPNRIKSAIGNRGTYDLGESDINKAEGGGAFKKLEFMADGGKLVKGAKKVLKKLMANDVLPEAERQANKEKFLSPSRYKERLYHATPSDFKEFKLGGNDPMMSGEAIWLSSDPTFQPAAHNIGDPRMPNFGVQVMPVHAQVTNPMVLDDKDMLGWAQDVYAGGSKEFPELLPKRWADEVRKDYDSIIFADPWGRGDPHEIIMFEPEKIKSAIGNRGTYDTKEKDITKADGGKIVGGLGKVAKKLMADNTLPAVEREANLQKFLEPSKTPMRLYHGTTATEGGKGNEAIRRIKPSKEGALGSGVYLTPNTAHASGYSNIPNDEAIDAMLASKYYQDTGLNALTQRKTGELLPEQEGGNMLPVHAQLRNPLIIGQTGRNIDPAAEALIKLGMDEESAMRLVERAYEEKGNIGKQIQSRAQSQGYDGIMQYRGDDLNEVVSYRPNAVKSATGNRGTYDINEPDLNKSDGGKIVKGLSKVGKKLLEEPRIQTIEAPSIIIPSKLSNVREMAKKREGEYGARRVERASDEISNLEKMYQEEALRSAFIGDNARALMTINPADFENYAAPLKPSKHKPAYASLEDRIKSGELYKDDLPTDEYVNYLRNISGGFESVPYLEINKGEQGLPLTPFISGHEGRHRNRALASAGEDANLIQLLPRAELREPFPRRSQEEYIDALKKELAMTNNMVLPEKFNVPSLEELKQTAPEIYEWAKKNVKNNSVFDKKIQRSEIELPDIYAEGGAAFKTLQFKDAQHFDGGGIAFPEMTPMTEGSRREPLLTEKDWENIKRNAPEVYEWAKQNVKDEASQLKSARGVKDFALRTGAQYLGGIPDLLNLGLMGVDALADTNLSSEKPWFGSEQYIDAMRKVGMVGENEFPIAETVAGVLMPAGLIKKGIKKISGAKPAKQEPKKRQGGLSAMAR